MAENCPVCGQKYGVVHSCRGAVPPAASGWIPPNGFAPLYYLRQALAIARFEDEAIVGASHDRKALLYGSVIWVIAMVVALIPAIRTAASQPDSNKIALALTVLLLLVFAAIVYVAQYGLCHLLARWWFGATGTFTEVLRAMLLGSIVLWLAVIPAVGPLLSGLWGIGVLMRVFEEVDRIGRMQAFGLAFVTGLLVIAFSSGVFMR